MSLRLVSLALASAIAISSVALSGCSVTPVATLEERLESKLATRPYPRERLEADIPYHVNLVFAHTILEQLQDVDFAEATPSTGTVGDGAVPIAIFDYLTAGSGLSLFGLATSFGQGDGTKIVRERYRVAGLNLTGIPNTNYYLVDHGDEQATPEDLDFSWDQAFRVFSAVHNRHGRCYANLWTPETLYSRVTPINARGVKKQVQFRCPHVLDPDLPDQLVTVVAFANPFEGYRTISSVQAQCLPSADPPGIDYRGCGDRLAAIQRPYLPETDFPLLELVTTPIPEDPTQFHVVGRFNGRETVLAAPSAVGDGYREWLATQPYSVD